MMRKNGLKKPKKYVKTEQSPPKRLLLSSNGLICGAMGVKSCLKKASRPQAHASSYQRKGVFAALGGKNSCFE